MPLISVLAWSSASAGTTDCRPLEAETFCTFLVGETNIVTQAEIDVGDPALSTAAWVINGSSTVRLSADSFTPGNSLVVGTPTIWVADQAKLEIDGNVSLAAHLYLCDEAELDVLDGGTLQFPQTEPFQYWLWAAGQSRVQLTGGSTLRVDADGTDRTFYMAMRGSSALDAPGPFSVTGGAWNLAVADNAVATLQNGNVLGEFAVAGNAGLSVNQTEFFWVDINTCDTTATVDGLPAACDLNATCFQPTHPLTTYIRSAVPSVAIANSKVYAWGVKTHPGSDTTITNIDPDASLAIDLAGLTGQANLTLPPSADPTGLTDRTVTVGVEPRLGWSIEATDGADLEVGTGSVLLDITAGGLNQPSSVVVRDAVQRFGRVHVLEGASVGFVDATVEGIVDIRDGTVFGVMSSFTGDWLVLDRAYLADSVFEPSALDVVAPDGWIGEVSLETPEEGYTFGFFPQLPIRVSGSISATADPIAATVSLLDSQGTPVRSMPITNAVESDFLAEWPTEELDPGQYEVRFGFDDGGLAVATRGIWVDQGVGKEDPTGDTGTSMADTGAADTAAEDTGSPGGGPDEPEGCGCSSTPGSSLGWFAGLIVVLGLRNRRRTP